MNRSILITGAAGFLGSKYCKYLLKKKYKVVALDINLKGLLKLKKNLGQNIKIFKIDITSVFELNNLKSYLRIII